MTEPLRLVPVLFGARVDPVGHPRWDGERIRPYDDASDRRFGHLLHSELDAIQKDPSRPPDDRLDAWEEEDKRLAGEHCPSCGGDAADNWFCRSVCPEPCGMMHTVCAKCGCALDGCPFESDRGEL